MPLQGGSQEGRLPIATTIVQAIRKMLSLAYYKRDYIKSMRP